MTASSTTPSSITPSSSPLEQSGSATRSHRLAAAAPAALRRGGRTRRGSCRSSSSRTRRASTSSITAGPMPSSGPAATTTRSCNAPCRSRRSPAPALLAHDAGAPRRPAQRRRDSWRRRTISRRCTATFATEEEAELARVNGWLIRHDTQYHWQNHGFATFDDFLDTLSSRHRKVTRRERRDALAPMASRSGG